MPATRISFVKQANATTVDIHEADEDGSIFDEYGNLLFRAVDDSTGNVRLIFYRGGEVLLNADDYKLLVTNLMGLLPEVND